MHGGISKYSILDCDNALQMEAEMSQIANEKVRHVDRVLDVRQGELCWVAGTVYMDMPLKPNILDDISKDVGGASSR